MQNQNQPNPQTPRKRPQTLPAPENEARLAHVGETPSNGTIAPAWDSRRGAIGGRSARGDAKIARSRRSLRVTRNF